MWVEPQPRLMFRPLGSALMTKVLAPRASKTALARLQALPLIKIQKKKIKKMIKEQKKKNR